MIERFKQIDPKEGRVFKAYMIKEDLICFEYHENGTVQKADVIEAIKVQESMVGDRMVRRLILTGKRTSMTPEGRRYFEKFGLPARKEAFVIQNFTQKMIYNLYYSVRRATHPVKTFESSEKAMMWLYED